LSNTPVLLCSLLALAAMPGRAAPQAAPAASAGITAQGAWLRATAPGQTVGAAYLTILNGSSGGDELIAVESPAAARAEMHESRMQDGMMRMRAMSAVKLAPRGRLEFTPGGLHIMLAGLKEPLVAGRTVALVLRFRHAGDVKTIAEIRSLQLGDSKHED
jgi:copper(I)-binding protein